MGCGSRIFKRNFICPVSAVVGGKIELMMPNPEEIKSACKDVAYEYVVLLGAALQIASDPVPPINHLAQEAFLVHVRNLGEFFRGKIEEFKEIQVPPERKEDNIYAVDLCHSVGWKAEPFGKKKNMMRAINKTLSHMTCSRDQASEDHAHFDGFLHLHGMVKLMHRTWEDFLNSAQAQYQEDIRY